MWLLTTDFFKKVRYAGKIFASLSAASIVGDSITDFRLASAIDNNKVSNVRQDGIRLPGGYTDIENNDITNATICGGLNRGGIGLQDSSLLGGSGSATVRAVSFS